MATESSLHPSSSGGGVGVGNPIDTAEETITLFNQSSSSRLPSIPCCICGVLIHPNAANQCGSCLASQFDLKSVLQRGPGGGELLILQCRQCRRYKHTSTFYAHHDPESPQLLALCLKQIPALSPSSTHSNNTSDSYAMKLTDSSWIWTEPHSMRLKLRLTVQADVSSDSLRPITIQQRLPVEFRVKFEQCSDCQRSYTNRTWHALVQIRQKTTSRNGLLSLEQAMAKNANMRRNVLRLQTVKNGFDFYFMSFADAQSFVHDVGKITPMKTKQTSKLVSEDVRNNDAHLKHTIVCDLVPLNKNDLIAVGKGASSQGGCKLAGRMCLVERVTNGSIRLMDVSPSRRGCSSGGGVMDCMVDLHPEKYWKGEKHYRVLGESTRLTRFVVLDVELCENEHNYGGGHDFGDDDDDSDGNHNNNVEDELNVRPLYSGPRGSVSKYALAEIEVARESDFGVTDETMHCVSYLGNLLQTGDVVLGYDLLTSVMTGMEENEYIAKATMNSNFVQPDVVLVKKAKNVPENVEDTHSSNTTKVGGNRKKERHKSSGSKKREKRRLRKEGRKSKATEEAVVRMGFVDGGDEEENEDETGENVDTELGKD